MLAEETVRTIKRLLNARKKLSQREIARRMKVNRETVNRIANGKRFDVAAYRRERAANEPKRTAEPIRCHGCGNRIYLVPCQACQLQKKIKRQQVKRAVHPNNRLAPLPLTINLKGQHRERYLVLRARKIRRSEKPADNLKLLSAIQSRGVLPRLAVVAGC